MPRIISLALLWVVLSAAPAIGATSQEQFQRAVALLKEKNFDEALPLLETVLEAHPNDPAVLWNYGIAAAEVGAHTRVVSAWKKYQAAAPDDWRARAKLVQAYQALGRSRERDAERTSLLKLRASGEDVELGSAQRFCREQFRHDGQKFFAFEYFEVSGKRPVLYAFTAVDASGDEVYRISLGSYDSTNEIVRELEQLPASGRLYHLDLYRNDAHSTLRFYESQPTYERVRSNVITQIEKRAE